MKILCFVLALLMSIPGAPQITSTQPSLSSAEYVINHFEEFIAEYNKMSDTDCAATSIEYKTEILVNDTNEMGYYLDFNDNNGFCIVTDDAVIDIYVQGDYPQMKEPNEYMYDVMDGFFVKKNDEYIPYLTLALPELDDTLIASAYSSYAILNADTYVKQAYGSSFKKHSQASISKYFVYQSQYNLSVYHKINRSKNTVTSEGNCVLSSIYATLSYLQRTGKYPKLPTGYTEVMTGNDSVAKTAKRMGYTPRAASVRLPRLYAAIRTIAISKYGYTVSGFGVKSANDLMRDVLKAYGYNVTPQEFTWLAPGNQHMVASPLESTIKTNINNGYPVLLNTYQVYGDGGHCVAVTGYAYYRRTYNLGIVKVYQYIKLFQVGDNHVTRATYFDYTRYQRVTHAVYFK